MQCQGISPELGCVAHNEVSCDSEPSLRGLKDQLPFPSRDCAVCMDLNSRKFTMLNGLCRIKRIVPVISVINKCPDCPVTTPRET